MNHLVPTPLSICVQEREGEHLENTSVFSNVCPAREKELRQEVESNQGLEAKSSANLGLVCGRQPSDPHHIRFAQQRALGRKVSDEFTVPLCRIHHRELHRKGDEAAWWKSVNIDPMPIALRLWQHSRCAAEWHSGSND